MENTKRILLELVDHEKNESIHLFFAMIVIVCIIPSSWMDNPLGPLVVIAGLLFVMHKDRSRRINAMIKQWDTYKNQKDQQLSEPIPSGINLWKE